MQELVWDRPTVTDAIATGTWQSVPLTDEEMFAIFEIDASVWKVSKRIVNNWAKNFQTKLWLERIPGGFESNIAVETLEAWKRNNDPPMNHLPVNEVANQRLLEIFLTDCHFDKLTWAAESGDNYDIKIARQIYLDATCTLISKAKMIGFDRILFIVGSDLFNSEGKSAATTKGTPQTVDVRWQKSFDFVSTTVREAIEMCASECLVDVLVIPGNHDYERTYYLGSVLAAWFETDPCVSIDNGPKSRKYYRHGKNLIMFDHGQIKPDEYGMIMATEQAENWALTDKRFIHTGHLHGRKKMQQIVDEKYGVVVEVFPSFTGTCGWHFNNGYIGNNKRASAKIFDAERGPEFEINYFIPTRMYGGSDD